MKPSAQTQTFRKNPKPISDLCDQHGIQPRQFYRWQQEFFERGSVLFESRGEKPSTALERKVRALEEKLACKDSVLAELMEEHMAPKKRSPDVNSAP